MHAHDPALPTNKHAVFSKHFFELLKKISNIDSKVERAAMGPWTHERQLRTRNARFILRPHPFLLFVLYFSSVHVTEVEFIEHRPDRFKVYHSMAFSTFAVLHSRPLCLFPQRFHPLRRKPSAPRRPVPAHSPQHVYFF